MDCIVVYNGKEYSHAQFMSMLHDGLLDKFIDDGIVSSLPEVVEPKEETPRQEAEREVKEFEKTADKKQIIDASFEDLLDELDPKAQITDTYPFRTMRGNTRKVAKALSEIAPDLTITVLGYKEYEARAKRAGMNDREAKNSAAFYDAKTDSIVINRLMSAANTLTHEAAHPVVAAAILARPNIAKEFADKLRDVKTPQGQTYGEWVDKNYLAPYTEDEKNVEIVCEFLSNVAIGKHKDLVGQSIWNDFIDFINSILSTLGVELVQPLNTDADVMDFAKQFARALKTGAVLKAERQAMIENGQIFPQITNNVSTSVTKKIGDLLSKGMSREDIAEVLMGEKYKPIREKVESEKRVDFETFLEVVFTDFETPLNTQNENVYLGNTEPANKRLKGVIDALNASSMDSATKNKMNNDLGQYYLTLPDDVVLEMGEAFVEKLGGLEEALDYVRTDKATLPIIKIFILGQAINTYKVKEAAANTKAEKEKWAEKQIVVANELDVFARDMGQALSYIRNIYYKSPLAVIIDARKAVARKNAVLAKNADKHVARIMDALEKPETVNEALSEVFDPTEMQKTLDVQADEIKRLEKELEKFKNKKTGTTISIPKPKGKRVNFGISKDDFKNALKFETRLSANPILDPVLYKKLGVIAGYGIQEGIRSFQDFYDWMNKNTKGKYQETYGDLYTNLRDKAIEKGAIGFDTDEQITEALTKIEELEQEIAEKKARHEAMKKTNAFGRLLSQPISQAQNRKTKEQNLREKAAELDALYNTDAYTKQAEAYLEGKRQEKLTTPSELIKAINKSMIEAGFVREVKGKQVVDWAEAVKGSKTPNKAWAKVDAVMQDMVANGQLSQADYDIQSPLLRDMFFATVNDKKIKAVQAEVNAIARKRGKFNRARRKTKAERLVEMYNTGALSNAEVKEQLAEEMGYETFTEEDEQKIQSLLRAIDRAPMGNEREILEEELYYFLDQKNLLHAYYAFSERMRARLLAGPITLVKNLTGVFTGTNMIAYKVFKNNILAVIGQGDAAVLKAVRNGFDSAKYTAADILWNGGVDMGSAFSETTGTKVGTARIRYIENKKLTPKTTAIGKLVYYPRLAALKLERVLSRGLSSADAMSAVTLKEVAEYDYIKMQVKRDNPTFSNKQASQRAYEIMYSVDMDSAIDKAKKEFEEREIELTESKGDQIRFMRRVHEIIAQQRSYATTKEGVFYANRYTFKAPDAGAGALVQLAALGIKKVIPTMANIVSQSLRKSGNERQADIIDAAAKMANDVIFLNVMPFISGVTNILEKRLEMVAPYGLAKSAIYTGLAFTKKDIQRDVAFSRAGEYAWRAAMGALMLVLIYGIADEDEEGGKLITASGTKDFKDNTVEKTLQPSNSVRMFGRNIPSQAFGTTDMNILLLGMYQDMKRERKKMNALQLTKEEEDAYVISLGERFMISILEDEYLRGFQNLYKGITDENKASQYWKRTLAEFTTRSLIPATGFVRQTSDMFIKEARKPISLKEHLMRQSGVLTMLVDKKAFDYRGRTYDPADVYANSTRGFTTSMLSKEGADEVDKFVYEYNPNVYTPSVINERTTLLTRDGEIRAMTEDEYYDYAFNKSQKFGKLIEAYYKTKPESKVYEAKLPEFDTVAYDKLEREAIASLKLKGQTVDMGNYDSRQKVLAEVFLIANENAARKAISSDINELNRLAIDAAMLEFCKQNGYIAPTYVLQSVDLFNQKLTELDSFKK